MNPAKNVCEEEASLNAILVRSDGKRALGPTISEWVAIIGTWGIEVRTRMVLEDKKWCQVVIPY